MGRMQRWQRAHRLGLAPPIEVLAVLVQGAQAGTAEIEMAHMDRLMGSTAVGAA